jgi:hypothetical protein
MPFVLTVALSTAAVLVGWTVCGVINVFLYRRIFGNPGFTSQRDLFAALGPMGLTLLILCALLMAYIKVCNYFGGDGGTGIGIKNPRS